MAKSLSDTEVLQKEVENTRDKMRIAYFKFSEATEPEQVDEAVFELKSLEARHKYLLKKYKSEVEK